MYKNRIIYFSINLKPKTTKSKLLKIEVGTVAQLVKMLKYFIVRYYNEKYQPSTAEVITEVDLLTNKVDPYGKIALKADDSRSMI